MNKNPAKACEKIEIDLKNLAALLSRIERIEDSTFKFVKMLTTDDSLENVISKITDIVGSILQTFEFMQYLEKEIVNKKIKVLLK